MESGICKWYPPRQAKGTSPGAGVKDAKQGIEKRFTPQGKGFSRNGSPADIEKKSRLDLGGRRGRLIPEEERRQTLELVREARVNGSRKATSCELLGLSMRTIERWEKEDGTKDRRKGSHDAPANKLTEEERKHMIEFCHSECYRDRPPSQIVPD